VNNNHPQGVHDGHTHEANLWTKTASTHAAFSAQHAKHAKRSPVYHAHEIPALQDHIKTLHEHYTNGLADLDHIHGQAANMHPAAANAAISAQHTHLQGLAQQ
jgi:hypothetical protein